MIYWVRLGRRSPRSLLPDLNVLVMTEEMLLAILPCLELENSNYIVQEVAEVSEEQTIKDLLLRSNQNGQP